MVRIPIKMEDEEEHAGQSHWIDVQEVRPGIFVIEDDSNTDYRRKLKFDGADAEIECVCIDLWIWNDVWLAPYWFRAPSLARLVEALQHVVWRLGSWD